MERPDEPILAFLFHTCTHEIFFILFIDEITNFSSVIEVAIVTVTDLLTDLMTTRLIKPGTKPVITLVIKTVTKPVIKTVTKPVNGIYEFGAFETDRFP